MIGCRLRLFVIFIWFILGSSNYIAQNIGINSTGANPDNSAMLDVVAADKGILIPRMTDVQRDLIAAPATGLLVFVTTDNLFYYFDGAAWTALGGDNDWSGAGTGSMYTTNLNDHIGIGEANPQHELVINSRTNGHSTLAFVNNITGSTNVDGFQLGLLNSEDAVISNREIGKRLFLRTESTDRLTILSTGNVGIGTTAPTSILEVNGLTTTTSFKMTTAPTAGYVLTTDANGVGTWAASTDPFAWRINGNSNTTAAANFIGTTNNVAFIIRTNNTERARVLGNGNFRITALGGVGNALVTANNAGTLNKTAFSGNATDVLDGAGSFVSIASIESNDWTINGNSGTDATNFIGTTDANDIQFKTNNVLKHRITQQGQIEFLNTGGSVFIGESSGENDDLSNNINTAVGTNSLTSNVDGQYNSAFGYTSLENNVDGQYNSAFGLGSLNANVNGQYNSAFGFGSLNKNVDGEFNTAIGSQAFFNGTSFNNSTAIGFNSAISGSNQVHIGNTAITEIKGQVSFTTYSDGRVKDSITEDVVGLEFIKKLRPVTYHFNVDKQNSLMGITDSSSYEEKYDLEKIRFTGFIAQEVEIAAKDVNYNFSGVKAPKNENELYGVSYAEFVVPLVKGMQEQQEQIEQLEKQIEELQQLIQKLVAE